MGAPATAENDQTRLRLIEAAGEVFSTRGFQSATVREICTQAGANVAAVNYHFGDKLGLYTAVLRHSMEAAGLEDLPKGVPDSMEPEAALRGFISRMLHRMIKAGERGAWHLRIMAHEMAQPTEALPRVVAEIIGPKYAAMRAIIGRIIGLPPAHETTRLCAHSVIAQVLHYSHGRPAIAYLWPELKMTPASLDRVAKHIADFSMCSLRAVRAENTKPENSRARTSR